MGSSLAARSAGTQLATIATAESVFPTGNYHMDGLTFGTDVNFIVPAPERNNPKFTGCIDRNA